MARATESVIDRFGVATIAEGLELRRAGITAPVTVYSPAPRDIPGIAENGFVPVVHSAETLRAACSSRAKVADVKLDTGMHRMGFQTAGETREAAEALKRAGVKARSVITHFASPGTEKEQYARYRFLKDVFDSGYGAVCAAETSASDGTADGYILDGVRIGRAAYDGAMRVTGRVISVKNVRRGEKVGYNGSYTAPEDTRLAVVSGGYADGVRRDYAGAVVTACGSAMTIAAVCMDVFMASGAPLNLVPGDETEVFSAANRDSLIAVSHANIYEIYTSFKGRTERKYIYENEIESSPKDNFAPENRF